MISQAPSRKRAAKILLIWVVLFQSIHLSTPGASAQAEPDGLVVRSDGVEGRVTSQGNPLVDAEVWDIEFVGNVAFVAGKFLRVIKATSDWSRVDQPFLAAFDSRTGQWLSGFKPTLDGPVWALEAGPNGDIIAGGEFTTVNGEARAGLVSLDPDTGATNQSFGARVERRFSDKLAIVRDVHLHENHLYAIGNFSHASDGATTMAAAKVARFNSTSGTPDLVWTPELSGRSGWAIDTDATGQRVFLGGEFTYINGAAGTSLYGAVDGSTGDLLPNHDNGFNVPAHRAWPLGGIIYDLAVSDDKVYLAGAEHFWEIRSVTSGASIQLTTSYNNRWFNDTQVAEREGLKVFIGCHCLRHHGYANHDITAATGSITGSLTAGMAGGEGVWAVSSAPDGCIWMGGDLRGSPRVFGAPNDGTMRWVGRFARFCGPDGPPPPPQEEFAIIEENSTWKVSAAASWPAGWTEPGFDDGSWQTVTADFGYGDGDETSTVSDAHRPTPVLGRHRFEVADPERFNHLIIDVQTDDGATIWVNGDPVLAHNIPDGPLAANTLALSAVWGTKETDWNRYLVPTSSLVAGSNVIAASVHQAWFSSIDLGFDLALTGSTEQGEAQPAPQISIEQIFEPTIVRSYEDPSRYLAGTEEPPADWATDGFDDNGWTAAVGTLGFGEVDINTELQQGFTSYYVRSSFDVNADIAAGKATLAIKRDDGIVVYLNGQELARDNMPEGQIDASTRAESYIWGRGETDPVFVELPPGTLRAGSNLIALEVHQAHPDSRDLKVAFEIRSTK